MTLIEGRDYIKHEILLYDMTNRTRILVEGGGYSTHNIITWHGQQPGCNNIIIVDVIPAKVILDGLKRNMSRGNSLSNELDLSSVLDDTRAYLYNTR